MFKNLYRKAFVSALCLGSSVMAFAQGETSGGDSTDLVSDGINTISETLQGYLGTAGGVIIGIITAGLAIWGIIALVGVAKRAFSAGKGR